MSHAAIVDGQTVQFDLPPPGKKTIINVGQLRRVIITSHVDTRHPEDYTIVLFRPEVYPSRLSMGLDFRPLAENRDVHYVTTVQEAIRVAIAVIEGSL